MRRATAKGTARKDELEIERQRHEALGIDFIVIELELADTFCKLAMESHSAERKRQHELSAHRALNAALDTLTRLHLKEKEAEKIVVQIEEVKALLETLEVKEGAGPKC